MNVNEDILTDEGKIICNLTNVFKNKNREIERLNNIIKEYKTNTIPTLEHNIDILVENEDRLNNIINECAEDILKELEENHHLSYGVALGIRQKLLDYRELKGE